MSALALYKSAEAQTRFEIAHKTLLNSWQVDFKSKWITTDFGETHVMMAGNVDSKAMVFVPGAQGTAAMWGPVVQPLAQGRQIFCVDLIDQVGLSKPSQVLKSSDDATRWLTQVLEALQLNDVDLVGNSLGSFVAASFAVNNPERVTSLTLTAPAATVSIVSPAYIFQVMFAMGMPGAYFKRRFLLNSGAGLVDRSDPLLNLLLAAMVESQVISKLIPQALKKEALARLTMPVLLLQGGMDKVNAHKPDAICTRLKTVIPHIESATYKTAGHLWSRDHLSAAGERIKQFVT